MKKKIIKIVNSLVIFVTSVMVVFSGIYIILNWPSFWQRVKTFTFQEQPVEAQEDNQKDRIIYLPKSETLNQYLMFPDFFVSGSDLQIENTYWNQMAENSILIPKLVINAPIQYLDTLDDETMKNKLKEGVVHYPNTAMPGQKGNVFIFGHSSYYWWDWSEYNSIFANLEKISLGDEILLKSQGKILIYRVVNTKVVESNDLSVLEQKSDYKLTLMTCTPLGTDLKRFIVEAELVN